MGDGRGEGGREGDLSKEVERKRGRLANRGMAVDEAGRRRYNHKRTNPKWDKEQLSKS